MAASRSYLPRVDFPGMRLGRHVNHDPESLRYLVAPPAAAATPKSVKWTRRAPVFNQGNLGSCTVNATLGALGTDPYWSTLPASVQQALKDPNIQAALVQPLYREVTAADPFAGAWEPNDTGSDGLTNAKIAKNKGWISGYLHATSLAGCHEAIQKAPFITGIPWMQDMFYPTPEGIVRPTGAMAGGHEIVCDEYDLARDLWWFTNSWSADWSKAGRFALSSADYQKLLSQQGDVTSFVPITAPTPVPVDPGPVSPITTDPLADFPYATLDKWSAGTKTYWTRAQKDAAAAYSTWRSAHR
jgi:hypothetical protein